MMIGVIVILVILLFIFLHFRKKMKKLVLPNVYLITGGVKSGKTFLSVSLAIKQYKKNLFSWYFRLPFQKFKKFFNEKLRRKQNRFIYEIPEKPVLYSNIPLRYVRFSKLTVDIVLRRVRLPLNSVVLIDEISLLADSLMIHSNKFNDVLKNFFKLFAHANGNNSYCICNTQSYLDNHFNVKRCVGSYLYISRKTKWPFITTLKVREMLNIDDHSYNVSGEDFELSLLTLWSWNKTYKKYDSRCYSSLTDDLPLANIDNILLGSKDSLKADTILSLQAAYLYYLEQERKERSKK